MFFRGVVGGLLVLLDEREDLVRNRFVNAAEREHLGHVTLTLEPHHCGTVTDSILCFRTIQFAKFVVYGDRTRRHSGTRLGVNIQFAPGQRNRRPG